MLLYWEQANRKDPNSADDSASDSKTPTEVTVKQESDEETDQMEKV